MVFKMVSGRDCQLYPLPTLGSFWAECALVKGLCVVHGAPTAAQCCPKESQSQIHNLCKIAIIFLQIWKIIFRKVYKRTSSSLVTLVWSAIVAEVTFFAT